MTRSKKVIEHENAFKAVIEPDGTFNGLEETDDDAITSSTVLNDVLRGTVELLKVDEDDLRFFQDQHMDCIV